MRGLFDRKRPEADAARRLKGLIAARFVLPETTTLAVAELRCHGPGCPLVETIAVARDGIWRIRDWWRSSATRHTRTKEQRLEPVFDPGDDV